jgi:hypothetical protein
MFFLLSIILLVMSVLCIVSLMRLPRASEVVLAWGLVAFANLVLVFQCANLLGRLNDRFAILVLQGFLLLVSAGLWFWLQRPALFPKFRLRLDLKALLLDRQNWPLLILFGVLFAALLIYVVLVYVVPPNNNDALAIHLARVLKWKQLGSYFPWETVNIWQVTFPVNAQLVYLWTILFTNSDHFIAYLPLLSGWMTALLVYLLAGEMGFARRPALFAAAVWLAFPVVQLHLTSARHDLISTWLFLTSFYFLYRWGKTRQVIHMVLSALALGLVVGTNFSIAAYLPGLVVMLVIWLAARRYSLRQMVLWGGAVLLTFLIFSSPVYISNLIHFHSPVGPDAAEMTSAAVTSEVSLGQYLLVNITRWCYQFLDFSGLPRPLAAAGTQAKAWTAGQLSALLRVNLEGDLATMHAHRFSWGTLPPLQEDEAWYGLTGFLLVFPTSLAAFWQGIKKRQVLLLAPAVFLLTSMVACSLIRPGWTPYDGRYFLPLAAICAALLPLWFEGKKAAPYLHWLFSLISVSAILMVVVFNPAKQIVGGSAIWDMNRIDRLTRQYYNSKEMLYLVEAAIPEDGVVAVASNNLYYQEYGIYGERFTRTVIEIFPPEKISDAAWMHQRGINYLLILVSPGYPEQIAEGFRYVESLGDWVVYANLPQNE